jgi:hypothetical protein
MATLKALERAAEQSVKEIKTTNREILDLIKTLKEIEELAGEADLIDLRNSTSLKSSLKQLQDEVSDLTQNLKALDKELNDTNSKIRKALR